MDQDISLIATEKYIHNEDKIRFYDVDINPNKPVIVLLHLESDMKQEYYIFAQLIERPSKKTDNKRSVKFTSHNANFHIKTVKNEYMIRVKLLRSDGESSNIFKFENNEYFLPISYVHLEDQQCNNNCYNYISNRVSSNSESIQILNYRKFKDLFDICNVNTCETNNLNN